MRRKKQSKKEKKRLAENTTQLKKRLVIMSNELGSATLIYQNLSEDRTKLDTDNILTFGDATYNGKNCYCWSVAKRHFITLAPTRSGKGAFLIVPNLLRLQAPSIVIDPKGENAWLTEEYRREILGHKTIILDPWGEVNRRYAKIAEEKNDVDAGGWHKEIATFNPLSILDPASDHYADDVAYIADALIINEGKDPHWDNSARELISGLIAYCVESFGEAASLPMVRLLLSKPLEEIAGIAVDAQKFGPESVAARKLGRFVVDSKEVGSIVSTALTQTAFLDSKKLAANMQQTSFSFDDLVNPKSRATIYLVLPVDKLYTYGRWLRLMVSLAIRSVARSVEPFQGPVMFYLDEFGTIGRLSAVAQAFGLMAGLNMTMWAFVQDLNQLKRDYPDDWETFIANSQAITAFNVMDQTTTEYLSRMMGKRTVERITQQTADERRGDCGFFGLGAKKPDPEYSQLSDQIFGRDLFTPDEIRTSKKIFLISRMGNSILDPRPYFKDVTLSLRAPENPFFEHSEEMIDALEDVKEEICKRTINTLQKAQQYADDMEIAHSFDAKSGYSWTVFEEAGSSHNAEDFIKAMQEAAFITHYDCIYMIEKSYGG